MGRGENGDGVLDPAVPAALLGASWLMVNSPARSLCERCRPEQAKGSASCAQRHFHSSEEGAKRRQGAVSRRWRVVRTVILAVAAGSILAALWATAVAGG